MKTSIDREERRWAEALAGKTAEEREQFMAEALQRAKDQFYAVAHAMAQRRARAGQRQQRQQRATRKGDK